MNNSLSNEIGFLIVSVKTANGALPVKDALVNIYENLEDENGTNSNGYLLYTMKTNALGQTEKIALPTKSKALSTVPGNPRPFMSYNIFVSRDGFFDSDVINAPVFQGITSIQPISLIPLSEYSNPNELEPQHDSRFVETPNTLL
jgi:hypothetical protein